MSTCLADFAAGEVEKAVCFVLNKVCSTNPSSECVGVGGQINILLWAPLYQLDLLDLKLERKNKQVKACNLGLPACLFLSGS